MSKAIADLLHEHEAISSAIQTLERMLAAMEKAAAMDTPDMRDFIVFLNEFVDKCHHGKEEQYLFPAMLGAGIRDKGGPVGVLLSEHAMGRQLIREMQDSIAAEVDLVKLAKAARELASLYRKHIHKEDMIMFPIAERVLAAPQLEMLYEGFEEFEKKVIGQGRHAELHAMLKSLQEKYPMK